MFLENNLTRTVVQLVCVLLIALGGGLFAFGYYANPLNDLTNPAEVVNNLNEDHYRDMRMISSIFRGTGTGFLLLGGLGLLVPWVEVLIRRQNDPTERI